MPKQGRGRGGNTSVGGRTASGGMTKLVVKPSGNGGASTSHGGLSSSQADVLPSFPTGAPPTTGVTSPTGAPPMGPTSQTGAPTPPPGTSPHVSPPVRPRTNIAASTPTRRTSGTQQSSYSSNPTTSASQSVSQSVRSSLPLQYPNYILQQHQQHPQPQFSLPHQCQHNDFRPQNLTTIQPQQPYQVPLPDEQHHGGEEDVSHHEPEEQGGDYQQLLDNLLAMPGRENLPRLNNVRIPGAGNLWFRRDKGKLSRVIAGIFRRNFDGPYYSWKVTPINVQERYWRKFASKYYWDLGITELVKTEFLKVAKRRMKGIVSQVRRGKKRPLWIGETLWQEMCEHWKTEDQQSRSTNASKCRNSNRGGLGRHIHVTGQWSYLQLQEEMEEELRRPVSIAEVFIRAHTRPDGSFSDDKAEKVVGLYKQRCKAKVSEMEGVDDGELTEEAAIEALSVEEQNQIFLQSTETDRRGNRFGLGSLVEVVDAGNEESAGGASLQAISDLKNELQIAHRKLAEQEAANERRDEELRNAKSMMSQMELSLQFLRQKDEGLASFLAS